MNLLYLKKSDIVTLEESMFEMLQEKHILLTHFSYVDTVVNLVTHFN